MCLCQAACLDAEWRAVGLSGLRREAGFAAAAAAGAAAGRSAPGRQPAGWLFSIRPYPDHSPLRWLCKRQFSHLRCGFVVCFSLGVWERALFRVWVAAAAAGHRVAVAAASAHATGPPFVYTHCFLPSCATEGDIRGLAASTAAPAAGAGAG